jgi:hypothetical protein
MEYPARHNLICVSSQYRQLQSQSRCKWRVRQAFGISKIADCSSIHVLRLQMKRQVKKRTSKTLSAREKIPDRYFSHRHNLPIIAEVPCGGSAVRINDWDECLGSLRQVSEGTRVLCFSGVEPHIIRRLPPISSRAFPISRNFFVDLSQHSK